MNYTDRLSISGIRPKMIIWRMSSPEEARELSRHECMLTIDNIARVARPIVILQGESLLQRKDPYELVRYGFALGLKMIIEASPGDLTDDILRRYACFGPKIFRVDIDGCIEEGEDTRYRQTPELEALNNVIGRLKKSGFEVHLCSSVNSADLRALSFQHDYALQHGAHGLYYHFYFQAGHDTPSNGKKSYSDEVIQLLARLKDLSPNTMYISPQCIKYESPDPRAVPSPVSTREMRRRPVGWKHACLGGKTIMFISPNGTVQICGAQSVNCGSLRETGFNVKTIWETSKVFSELRGHERTCAETRRHFSHGRDSLAQETHTPLETDYLKEIPDVNEGS